MRKITFGSLILFIVILAAACSSGDGDDSPEATAEPTIPWISLADPEKAGEYVNLPEIYRDERGLATYGSDGSVPNTAPHVTGDVDYDAVGNSNPPAGGPHWSGGCPRDPTEAEECGPAPWGIYRDPWPAETVVHNMEHGGTVIWYNTTDQAVIDDLEDYVGGNSDKLLVLTPYPEMEAEHVAITIWSRIDLIAVGEYSREFIDDFMDDWYCHWDPEGFC